MVVDGGTEGKGKMKEERQIEKDSGSAVRNGYSC
jgi:hypothetical protein